MGWLKTTVNYIKHKLSQKGPQSPKVKSDLSHMCQTNLHVLRVLCSSIKKIFACRDILIGLQNVLFPLGVQIFNLLESLNLSDFMLKFNPLTLIGDQDRISPYNINTISTR